MSFSLMDIDELDIQLAGYQATWMQEPRVIVFHPDFEAFLITRQVLITDGHAAEQQYRGIPYLVNPYLDKPYKLIDWEDY